MDFIDQLKQFKTRIEKLSPQIETEEATKTSLIMPFFQLLGYDVFNPDEFLPEFTADVGLKKGEKVDYAIMQNDEPIILIEAKWCKEKLDKHDSQLYRYFHTTSAKFAILTNGIIYRFYTDLDETNKMDNKPFLEFNLLELKDNIVPEIKKFTKDSFNLEQILDTASDLKYTTEIINYLSSQLDDPSDDFIKYILSQVYSGIKTQNVIDRFRGTVKKSFNQFINEIMNKKLKSVLSTNEEENSKPDVEEDTDEPKSKIVTTLEELEGFIVVRNILKELLAPDRVFHKDTESYFGILIDNNTRKWVCRLKLDGPQSYIIIPDENKNQQKYTLNLIDDIYQYKNQLIDAAKNYI